MVFIGLSKIIIYRHTYMIHNFLMIGFIKTISKHNVHRMSLSVNHVR